MPYISTKHMFLNKSKMTNLFTLIILCSFFIVCISARDMLSANQTMVNGDTIVSAGGEFELGFFSPGSSKNQYLSIRYNKAGGTIVWVANRGTPITDAAGTLAFSSEGTLEILNGTNTTIWSSNSSKSLNPVAQLLDTGNLVIRTENDPDQANFHWQSFDNPDNTFLPGMKIGKNLATGLDWSYNSWKSNDDPSPGNFQVKMDISGYPQLFLWNGSARYIRIGPWNGATWSGIPNWDPNNIFLDDLFLKDKEIYYNYEPLNDLLLTRIIVEPDGRVISYTWINQSNKWEPAIFLQAGYCDDYARCGAYASCNVDSLCRCLDRFRPQNLEAWRSLNFSEGCIPERQLNCSNRDDFVLQTQKKLPDTQGSSYNFSMNLKDCKKKCLENCSCTAYANTNITGKGSGCLLWFGDLIDITDQEQSVHNFYVRVIASGSGSSTSSRARRIVLIVLFPIIIILMVLVLGFYLWHVCKHRKKKGEESGVLWQYLPPKGICLGLTYIDMSYKYIGELLEHETGNGRDDLPVFDFRTIANATTNFCNDNKLGEGGFGPVYKGVLEDGQDIAVKRHSTYSTQGAEEFTNEVSCIAKLQHRNLVRLLGWCTTVEGERMLVYEYMPNKSLDHFIFGDIKHKTSLDWPKRYSIINGIAKGLLYLHEDSRLRVIHRDLKASNILLDNNMNPKISDFGVARSFGDSETESNTARVVGTYGYMSPEYAIEGAFSVKSDVYSFGVLVIEIVTGIKCRFFNHPGHNLNLIGHVWETYKQDRLLELIDVSILESTDQYEVFRVILIGLLCVQQYPEDRPNMSSVLMMLTSKVSLPQPKQPGFFTERKLDEAHFSSSKREAESPSSSNQTVTVVTPR